MRCERCAGLLYRNPDGDRQCRMCGRLPTRAVAVVERPIPVTLPNSTKVILPCAWCGTPVYRYPSEAARRGGRAFCDSSCTMRDRHAKAKLDNRMSAMS